MKMAAEQRVAAPRQRVWEALNDPDILRASIPGCQSLERQADDRFAATIEVKVGPIGARFKGLVLLADLLPSHGYTLHIEGNGGIAGSVKGSATVRLRDDADGTLIAYEADAQLGGRMAQLGGSLIDATAKQLAGKFFQRFGELVVGGMPPEAIAHSSPTNARMGGSSSLAAAPSPTKVHSLPMAWILATVVAVLAGFLMGRSHGALESDWAGVAIGLLIIVVAGTAFEYGRRAAAPVVTLDRALLRRLLDEPKE